MACSNSKLPYSPFLFLLQKHLLISLFSSINKYRSNIFVLYRLFKIGFKKISSMLAPCAVNIPFTP